jgi:hypothetical protein
MSAAISGEVSELQRVLGFCHECWEAQTGPSDQRVVCYRWLERRYREAFGCTFHPTKLQQLTRLGFLERAEVVRGGARRYYRLTPNGLAEIATTRLPRSVLTVQENSDATDHVG